MSGLVPVHTAGVASDSCSDACDTSGMSDVAGAVLESDVEEAARVLQEEAEEEARLRQRLAGGSDGLGNIDDVVDEMLMEQEEAELDAYLMDYADGTVAAPSSSSVPVSQTTADGADWMEDDEDYDEIFMEFLEGNGRSEGMDMS